MTNPTAYEIMVHALHQIVETNYTAFSKHDNPATHLMGPECHSNLCALLTQYSFLPQAIVALLDKARVKMKSAGWTSVAHELGDNMAQEQGSLTKGVSHYDLLVDGLKQELSLDVGPSHPENAVTDFLLAMSQCLSEPNTASVAGSVYALEYTATPEIIIVKRLINCLHLHDKAEPLLDGKLFQFLEMHIQEIEPEHERALQCAIQPFMTQPQERRHFMSGFIKVLDLMETWWQQMVEEAHAMVSLNEVSAQPIKG